MGNRTEKDLEKMYKKYQGKKVKMMNKNRGKGTCDVCGIDAVVNKNHGVMACSQCQNVQARFKKFPEKMMDEFTRLNGNGFFSIPESGKNSQEEEAIQNLEQQLDTLNAANKELATQLQEQEQRVLDREQTIGDRENIIEDREEKISDLEAYIKKLEEEAKTLQVEQLKPEENTPTPELEAIAWKMVKGAMTGNHPDFTWDDIQIIRGWKGLSVA